MFRRPQARQMALTRTRWVLRRYQTGESPVIQAHVFKTSLDESPSSFAHTHLICANQNVTARFVDSRYCDGDAMVVRNSDIVNIDAGRFQ